MSDLALSLQTKASDALAPATTTLLHVVRVLVAQPDRVEVLVSPTADDDRFLLSLSVAPSDLERVVGTHERTARSLQSLVTAMARKAGQRIDIEFKAALQPAT